jgi:Zn-dependent protease with chaperone function
MRIAQYTDNIIFANYLMWITLLLAGIAYIFELMISPKIKLAKLNARGDELNEEYTELKGQLLKFHNLGDSDEMRRKGEYDAFLAAIGSAGGVAEQSLKTSRGQLAQVMGADDATALYLQQVQLPDAGKLLADAGAPNAGAYGNYFKSKSPNDNTEANKRINKILADIAAI